MKYSREQRAEQRQQNATSPSAVDLAEKDGTGPVFFWREYEEPFGFLCQWYTSHFQDMEVHPTHTFNCAEQYMMYKKVLILARPDPENNTPTKGSKKASATGSESDERFPLPGMILAAQKPGHQKELARSVSFSPSQFKEWERNKFDVVVQGSWCKYTQNADLRARLLATGERELVEASPQDLVWGIGFKAEFAEMNRVKWGSNLLGKALMSVRERIKAEQGET